MDWLAGAAGFEPLHLKIGIAKTLSSGGEDIDYSENLRVLVDELRANAANGGRIRTSAFRNQIRCCRSWSETFFGNEVRHDNFNRDAHVRVLPPRAESLREF